MKRFGTISVFVDCKTGSLAPGKTRARRRESLQLWASSFRGPLGTFLGGYVCVCVFLLGFCVFLFFFFSGFGGFVELW